MDMRVDAAGDDDLPGRVDGALGAQSGKAAGRADGDDPLALDADIGLLRAGGEHGGSAGNDDIEHGCLL
jgi:hypothetical protein